MRTNLALASLLALALTLIPSTHAQTITIRANQAGSTVYISNGTNTVGWAGANYAPRVGEYFSHGSDLVLPFQLPTLAPGAQFATADFRVWLFNLVGQTNVPFTVDLYALPARSPNTVLPADFYANSNPDPNATLLQASYLTPGMTNGHGSSSTAPAIVTSSAANTNLVNYLNSQYNSGAGAGSWIFLRLSPATNTFNGNYAYCPMTSMAGETWAWPMLEYTTTANTNTPSVQTNNQTINIVFPVQGLAYAKVNVSPVPLGVTPIPDEGVSTPSVRNPSSPVTYQYTFPPNTTVTVSKNQFTGSDPNTDIRLSTVDCTGTTLMGQSVTTLALDGATWNVQVYALSTTNNPTNTISGLIPDPYTAPPPPAISGAFPLVGPADQSMITSTRRPPLSWSPVVGTIRYDVYLNLSLTNYDWMAPGSLLNRFTLVGSVTSGTTYSLQQDLPDRWTYKWYIVATDGTSFTNRSDLRTFSIYLPNVTTVQDGITNINGMRDLNKDGVIEPYEDWHNPPALRVADLMSRMTLHEKAMQLFFNAQVFPDAGWAFGPFQAGDLFAYQKTASSNRLGIPFLSAGDTIHGYKTTYPTQPGLAATRNVQLAWAVSDVQRRESVAIGYRGTLSPLAEVGTKVLYPRIQEGNGEDADLAAGIVRAMVVGLQGGPEINPQSIMITTKHWCGQGAGGESDVVYDGTTIHYHMRPWHAAIEAGTSTIMPGYAGCPLLGPQGGGAGDNPGILGYLRTNMGYKGVICTDWLPSGAWTNAAIAGSDVMGGADPAVMGTFETVVPSSRIDDAVTRVFDLKFRMGIFEDPYGNNINGISAWHTPQNVAIVHQAAVECVTLLKNDGALPIRLPAGSSIVVTGPRANDTSCMVTWRSDFHNNDFGSKTIYQAIMARAAQDGITVYSNAASAGTNTIAAAIVVVGESYYTHGTYWDKNSPWLPDDPIGAAHDTNDMPQFSLIQYFRSNNIPATTICLLPRPYVLTNVVALSDAFMVVYRPGDEGGPAIAEILFGDHLPSGKTPWQLPRGMDQVGIDDSAHWSSQPDKWDLPYDLGATAAELAQIRTNIAAGLPVPPTTGNPLFQYGSGIQGFGLVDATPPQAFNLLTPANAQNITGAFPAFTWQAATDPETGIARFELYIDDALVATTTKATSYNLSGATMDNGAHSWYVKACNWAGGSTASPTFTFTINDTVPPATFLAWLPADNTTVNSPTNVTFLWEQTTDSGTGIANYALLLDGTNFASISPGACVSPTNNLAFNQAAYASSTNFGTPGAAVDGDITTRWSSAWTGVTNADTEWFMVDLGANYSIKEVVLKWENACGKEYLIQASTDNATWTTLYHKTNGTGGTNDLTGLSSVGRYVRMQGITRGTVYGYSLWEFQVFGLGTEQVTVPVPGGVHSWQIRATDGAGNMRINSNSPLKITSFTPFMLWQTQYFGSFTNPAAAPDADASGTGQNNLFKYTAGLNPTNRASVFMLQMNFQSNQPSLSFGPVWSNRFYNVQSRTDLFNGNWADLTGATAPSGNGSHFNFTDTNPLASKTFYRVGISLP
jgi:beta-glucosidase-like glycosyl hydrolase